MSNAVPKIYLMKYSFFAVLSTAALLLSCSASSDDGEEIPPTEAFELKEKIIGKWDVDIQEVENKSGQKQSSSLCYIFSLIFNADGSFIITYQDGTVTGKYEVVGENLISLGDAGEIGNIRFTFSGIGFVARLDDFCTATVSAMRDDEYSPGNCFAFLSCQDDTVWVSREDDSVVFLQFENQTSGEFFVRKSFYTEQRCQTTTGNENGNTTLVMIANYTRLLRFILERESPVIYYYTLLENGKLQEEIQTTEETRIRTFEPASESEMDPYLQYVQCGEKTYVPDDIFEKELIRLGYDDVLDDYVLTENIETVERFYLSDHSYPLGEEIETLTGLQDFTALSDLYLQVRSLPEIDLSENFNLERLFLGAACHKKPGSKPQYKTRVTLYRVRTAIHPGPFPEY